MVEYISRYLSWLGDQIRDFFLEAQTPAHKLTLMVVAVLLFVLVMGLILWLVDRPKKARTGLVAAAFVGPAGGGVGVSSLYGVVMPGWSRQGSAGSS